MTIVHRHPPSPAPPDSQPPRGTCSTIHRIPPHPFATQVCTLLEDGNHQGWGLSDGDVPARARLMTAGAGCLTRNQLTAPLMETSSLGETAGKPRLPTTAHVVLASFLSLWARWLA